ncbi:MAG: anti-sigma factor [Rhodocyclaceae bacterium]|nr:anti-sigma factor [Rhodocyclaceae bacterium]
MNERPISDQDLHAYVDGELSPARRIEVEAWLSVSPEAAAQVQTYQEQNLAIKALFNPLLNETVPERLLQAARTPNRTAAAGSSGGLPAAAAPWSPWSLQRIAASIVLAVASAGAGWFAHDRLQPAIITVAANTPAASPLAHQAAVAHVVYSPEVKRPVEVGADQEEQLVKWLSKRLNADIRPPRLGGLGYELIGGRLLPGSSGPVAQFMYHDASGQRLTLYVSTENRDNKDTAFRFAQEGPVNVFYWIDGKFGYALSAGIAKSELARIAGAVYAQLGQKH